MIQTHERTTIAEVGDVVSVETGKYRGCRLTLAGRVGGWFVCLNSNEVGRFVRVRRASFVRKGELVFDAAKHDRVFHSDLINRIKFAQQMTGAR